MIVANNAIPLSLSVQSAGCTRARSKLPIVSTSTSRLRPKTFFAGVEAAVTSHFGRLHTLVIHNAGTRFGVAPGLLAHLAAQGVVDRDPGAIAGPLVKVVAHGPPERKVMRHQAPLTAGAGEVHQRIEDLPPVHPGRAAWPGVRGQ